MLSESAQGTRIKSAHEGKLAVTWSNWRAKDYVLTRGSKDQYGFRMLSESAQSTLIKTIHEDKLALLGFFVTKQLVCSFIFEPKGRDE